MSYRFYTYLSYVVLVCFALAHQTSARVAGTIRSIPPALFKSASAKQLVETAQDHQWAIDFQKNGNDTIHVIALRIEFAKDTSTLTTGNGLFGIRSGGDKEELENYNNDTTYRYDALPHDSLYFNHQLASVKNYFTKVSRGKLTIDYTIYPSGSDQVGFTVDTTMTGYSPGGKKSKESYNTYWERKTIGVLKFARDALKAASKKESESPFTSLRYDATDKTLRDSLNHKTVILLLHAGSSYLTDGGEQGAMGQDTPSDLIDFFITPDYFKYYKDSLKLAVNGVNVPGKGGALTIDEIMMCSETSNQDGLNWGIQGILVNQIARQLGIPDLFSTSSGVSGIGAFCIMDFAGYSAGNGFIPPYPSAWVRAFMGWDQVKTVPIGEAGSHSIKALTAVLDRDNAEVTLPQTDTTILLVPINDHEYYLIENRQRNLSATSELFRYDTISNRRVIAGYPYNVNIAKNVTTTSGNNASNVILQVKNNDVSLPASGVLVWHVDERIIRDKLPFNMVNADSSYRGISLVEADGITDLGVAFQDAFYQAAFDYGGSEDVFPHTTKIENSDTTISVHGFGPYTLPSSRSNDGGHSYIELSVNPVNSTHGEEITALGKNDGIHFISNVSDSLFLVSVAWNYLSPTWPRRAAPDRFFDPLFVDVDKSSPGKELFLMGESGRCYLWSAATNSISRYNRRTVTIDRLNLLNDTLHHADTIAFYDSLPGLFTFPSAIDNAIYIPSSEKALYVLQNSADSAVNTSFKRIPLRAAPSTWLCNYHDSSWAIGCSNGSVILGTRTDTTGSITLSAKKSITAIAAVHELPTSIAIIQTDGTLSLCNVATGTIESVKLPAKSIGPYTLVTGDLDRASDSSSEIVVCDSRHGVWVYKSELTLAPGWEADPTDWPSAYRTTTENDIDKRSTFPVNTAAPALADINRDGHLDIVIGGTNGLYAFNYKGALIDGWPSYLDKKYWYQRYSVTSSPVVVTGTDKKPLVLFSSLTGENVTYRYTKVTRADKARGTVWFETELGTPDSITDLRPLEIDTILTMGDSLVPLYVIPGGMVDAVQGNAKRPHSIIGTTLQSRWPLSTGTSVSTAPLIGLMDENSYPDLVAVSASGWVYRWEPGADILPDTLFWPQTGYSSGRTFAYGGKNPVTLVTDKDPMTFFSFPNPTRGNKKVTFKYKFSSAASKVCLDIYSYTGFKVYSHSTMGSAPQDLSGSYPDWNVHVVPITQLGTGVYRCRLEALVNGVKQVRYWKMAVVK